VPSADQSSPSTDPPLVSGVTPAASPPWPAMTPMSCAPKRFVTSAIRSPSGDHLAPWSNAGSVVSLVSPDPSVAIAQMSRFPLATSQSNAIRSPAGDQSGSPRKPAFVVIRATFVPSLFMTYRSLPVPAGSFANAIFVPSGDHAGADPGPRSAMVPSARFRTEIPVSRTNATRLPFGENAGALPFPNDQELDASDVVTVNSQTHVSV
jgi:hypothetical protein